MAAANGANAAGGPPGHQGGAAGNHFNFLQIPAGDGNGGTSPALPPTPNGQDPIKAAEMREEEAETAQRESIQKERARVEQWYMDRMADLNAQRAARLAHLYKSQQLVEARVEAVANVGNLKMEKLERERPYGFANAPLPPDSPN